MTRTTGYYFVIQYCPDLARMEGANVGVVLLREEPFFLQAKTAPGNDRIRRFFSPVDPDWEQINLIKFSVQRRLTVDRDQFRTLDALKQYAATRANAMRLIGPRSIAIEEPNDDLNKLFDQLVGGKARSEIAAATSLLDQSLSSQDVARFICRDLTVNLPLFHRRVRVPYGFRNGRLNLIQPVRFRGRKPTGILQTAGQYALEGQLLHQHEDPRLGPLKLIVVGDFAEEQHSLEEAVGQALRINQTDLYTTKQLPQLVAEIRSTGQPNEGDRGSNE